MKIIGGLTSKTKPPFLLFLVGLIAFSCHDGSGIPEHSEMERSRVKAMGLKGNILLLETDETHYAFSEEENAVMAVRQNFRSLQFNTHGQLVREEVRKGSGSEITSIFHDVYGRRDKIDCTTEQGEGIWYERFSYYDHGKLREKQRFNADELLESRENYVYDDSLNLTKVTNRFYNYDGEGNREEKVIEFLYRYDETGTMIEERNGKVGQPQNVITYEKGRLVTKVQELVQGGTVLVQGNTYDAEGRIQEILFPDFSHGKTYKQFNLYDSTGNQIEKKWSAQAGVLEGNRVVYQYDSLGNKVSETQTFGIWDSSDLALAILNVDQARPARTVLFEYDAQGNWISRLESEGEVIRSRTTRKLTYRPSRTTRRPRRQSILPFRS